METTYSHILAAVEVNASGEQVLARAQGLAQRFGARLSVLHAVEYIPLDAGAAMIATPVELSQQLEQQARAQLLESCTKLGIAESSVRVSTGGVVAEILRVSKEIGADLIVVGHHPRSGLAALFSYTDEGVVHRARCDVLALNMGR